MPKNLPFTASTRKANGYRPSQSDQIHGLQHFNLIDLHWIGETLIARIEGAKTE